MIPHTAISLQTDPLQNRPLKTARWQEELSQAKSNENRALIDYQKSLIHWEAVTGQTFKKNGIEFVAS